MAFIHSNPHKQRFTNNAQSAVNNSQFANPMPKRIRNKVDRECARDGFRKIIEKELAGECTIKPPLYSHDATRQSFFNYGWKSANARDIEFAKLKQQASPNQHLPIKHPRKEH